MWDVVCAGELSYYLSKIPMGGGNNYFFPLYCPCHDGYFDPNNGAVARGPPPTRLPEYGVLVQNNSLYVTTRIIN